MRRLVIFLLALIATTSLSRSHGASQNAVGASAPAVLLGFERDGSFLHFDIISTGCTYREDFRIVHAAFTEGGTVLTLERLSADRCRRRPFRQRISFKYCDVARVGLPLTISNTFAAKAFVQTSVR